MFTDEEAEFERPQGSSSVIETIKATEAPKTNAMDEARETTKFKKRGRGSVSLLLKNCLEDG